MKQKEACRHHFEGQWVIKIIAELGIDAEAAVW